MLKLVIQVLLLIGVFFSMLGCSVELKNKEADATVNASALEELKLTHQLRPQELPNQYQAEFSWKPVSGMVRIWRNSQIEGFVPGMQSVFSVRDLKGGEEFMYEFEHVDSEGQILSKQEISFQIPLDLVLSGSMELKEDVKWEYERIFISRDLILTTANKNLLLKAKDLIADGGLLQNYFDQARAPKQTQGRSGGNIQIMAGRARGDLRVVLRGEAGGNGLPGVRFSLPHLPGIGNSSMYLECPGTNGEAGGNAGNLMARFGEGRSLRLTVENLGGAPGLPGLRGSAPVSALSESKYPSCGPLDGVQGAAGVRGQECVQLDTGSDYICR